MTSRLVESGKFKLGNLEVFAQLVGAMNEQMAFLWDAIQKMQNLGACPLGRGTTKSRLNFFGKLTHQKRGRGGREGVIVIIQFPNPKKFKNFLHT